MAALRSLLLAAVVIATAAPGLAARAAEPLHAVVNVDIIPDDLAVGQKLLTDFVHSLRKDLEVSSAVLLQQLPSVQNHFILEEVFPSRQAYDQYVRKDYVRNFRKALYPHLGSPWDERLGTEIAH